MASARVKQIFAAFLLAVTLAAPAQAGPYEDAIAAYNRDDFATAEKLFRKAADQGHAQAQFKLGVMYSSGEEGVLQGNDAKAVKWYRKAAEQGEADVQFDLGFMYDEGRGVPQDCVQAHKWYSLAISQLAAGEARHFAVENRNKVASKMTGTQIAEAQRLAREWKPK